MSLRGGKVTSVNEGRLKELTYCELHVILVVTVHELHRDTKGEMT